MSEELEKCPDAALSALSIVFFSSPSRGLDRCKEKIAGRRGPHSKQPEQPPNRSELSTSKVTAP